MSTVAVSMSTTRGTVASSTISKTWRHTEVKVHEFNYKWTISNFSFCCQKVGEAICSSTFSSGQNDELRWNLGAYPKGNTEANKDYLGLHLRLQPSKKTDVQAGFRFHILNNQQEKAEETGNIQHMSKFKQGGSLGWAEFVQLDFLLDEANGLLLDDNLTLICEARVMDGGAMNMDSNSGAASSISSPNLLPSITVTSKWCHTHLEVQHVRYTWTISNFSFCCKEKGDVVESSTFSAGENNDVRRRLRLYPKGKDEESKDCLSLFLLTTPCSKEVHGKYKFAILDAKGEEKNEMRREDILKFAQNDVRGFPRFIKQDLLYESNDLLVEDKLTVVCGVAIVDGHTNVSGQSNTGQLNIHEGKLSDDLGKLFESRQFTDVTLACDGREFHCIKALLAARSRVFAAMFEHDMEESRQNRVEVMDIGADVMDQLLRFIYTGRAAQIKKMAADLLMAADKYDVNGLKVMCEEALSKSLGVENVSEFLVLADQHSAEHLKAKAIQFINNGRMSKVMKTAGWQQMVSAYPHIVAKAVLPDLLSRYPI